jgi:hypothetical protein
MDWIRLAEVRGPMAGSYEHGNGPSSFIKCSEILASLSGRRLVKDSTRQSWLLFVPL